MARPVLLNRTPPFDPQWEGVFERWTHAYMRTNHWKLAHELDFDEALQECAFVFSWCRQKCTAFGGRIDNAPWFMSYYQQAVYTMVKTKAVKSSNRRETALAYRHVGPRSAEQEGPLAAALMSASEELRQVLDVVAKAPSEFLELLLKAGNEITWSRRLCRLCGVANVKANVVGELKKLLTE